MPKKITTYKSIEDENMASIIAMANAPSVERIKLAVALIIRIYNLTPNKLKKHSLTITKRA